MHPAIFDHSYPLPSPPLIFFVQNIPLFPSSPVCHSFRTLLACFTTALCALYLPLICSHSSHALLFSAAATPTISLTIHSPSSLPTHTSLASHIGTLLSYLFERYPLLLHTLDIPTFEHFIFCIRSPDMPVLSHFYWVHSRLQQTSHTLHPPANFSLASPNYGTNI